MQELAQLNATFGKAGAIEFQSSPLGGIVAHLISGESKASVALQGAQVLSWQPAGHDEVLWLSPMAKLGTGTPVRGGIPVCWPWFAVHPQDQSKPLHGFVRTRDWNVTEIGVCASAVRLILGTQTRRDDAALWPHSAEVTLQVELGSVLRLTLSTRNIGAATLPLTQALHSYFRIGDIERVHIEGLGGRDYIDKVDGNSRKRQAGAKLLIDREVDRIYQGDTAAVGLIDAALGRRIDVVSSGSRSTVVWNPWLERSARMAEVGDGYRTMLCIETANAGDDLIKLEPGGAHTLRARLSVGTLEV
jgi:D-hexose-6-phosphate mutarotase